LLLAQILESRGDRVHAPEEFQAAASLNPASAEAWYGLGMALARRGQGPQAEECLRKAVGLRPDSDLFRAGLALVLDALAATKAEDGQWQDAIDTEEEALQLAVAAKRPDLEKLIQEQLERYKRHETGGESPRKPK
jgi:tetratricopeptide (TPR) repeat protein